MGERHDLFRSRCSWRPCHAPPREVGSGKPDGGRRGALMDFLQPTSWQEALDLRAERPDAVPIAGGTDVMVDINFDRRRPGALLDLTRVAELREWTTDDGTGSVVRLGAGVPYSRIVDDLADRLPGLAMASRTVGSPQIRVRGTVGGNLGSASPAGDARPPPRGPPPRPCWPPTRSSRSPRPRAARASSRRRSSTPG